MITRGYVLRVGLLTTGVWLAVIVQVSVFGQLPLLGVRPDLALLVVVCLSLGLGRSVGAGLGLAAGLLLDLLTGHLIGLNIGTKLLVGYAAGVLGERVFRENLMVPFLAVLGATLVDQILYVAVGNAFGLTFVWLPTWRDLLLPLMLYHLLLTPFVYVLAARMVAWVRGDTEAQRPAQPGESLPQPRRRAR